MCEAFADFKLNYIVNKFRKKVCFQDLSSQHFFFFCQINLNNLVSSDNLLF